MAKGLERKIEQYSLPHQQEKQMTQSQFAALCTEKTIEPQIALENEDVIKAIRSSDWELLIKVLDTQF